MSLGKTQMTWQDTDKIASFICPSLLFLISFLYFFWFGNGVFFLQENKSLFIFSKEYLHDFLVKPGGMLEYAGNFVTMCYFNKLYASLVISIFLLLFYALFFRLNKLMSGDSQSSSLVALIPSCFLLLMQVREDHLIHHTIGYLFTVSFLLVGIISVRRKFKYLVPALFPLFFYITGSFALLFLILYFDYYFVSNREIQKYHLPVILILTALITFYAFEEILFLRTPDRLLRYPLNIIDINNITASKIFLIGYLVLFPFIVKMKWKLMTKEVFSVILLRISLIIVFCVTLFFLGTQYDPEKKNDLMIEKLFFEQNWSLLIAQAEKISSKNEITQYYYHLALTERGELCDRMFSVPHDYGIKSLVLPRKREFISRSFYFYYTIGLINEAHHLAYESMVLNGYCPENLKMLVKTDIINGNYKIAESNINILKKTLHYRRWAIQFEKMLYNPENVISDPEFCDKVILMPRKDFFIGPDDEENMDFTLMANPDNKKAFEYKMAFLLLEKKYRAVMYQVKRMKDMQYTTIPRHIEESMMIFINRKDELPYLGDYNISKETENRFNLFLNDLRLIKGGKRPDMERFMKNKWGNTFWYYFEFK